MLVSRLSPKLQTRRRQQTVPPNTRTQACDDRARTSGHTTGNNRSSSGSDGPKGLGSGLLLADHRSEDDRSDVPRNLAGVLRPGRGDGAAHAHRARAPRTSVLVAGAVLPTRHNPRHDHAVAVRDADRVRVREPAGAVADRVARRRVPPSERLLLLAVPVRRGHGGVWVPHPERRCGLRLVWLLAAHRRRELPGCGRGPVDYWTHDLGAGNDPGCGQHGDNDHHHACAGHDDVPDADRLPGRHL